jgi:hypothetical protein
MSESRRPALQWGWVADYLRQNQVTDKSVVIDDDGRTITGAAFDDVLKAVILTWWSEDRSEEGKAEPLTIGALKALAPEGEAADGYEFRFAVSRLPGDYVKIVDLGFHEDPEGDGTDYFEFQRRWG